MSRPEPGSYIQLTVVTKVNVPLTESISKEEMEAIINNDQLLEDDRIDWATSHVIEEDYSYAAHDFKMVDAAGPIYVHDTPYAIGTRYEDVELTKIN